MSLVNIFTKKNIKNGFFLFVGSVTITYLVLAFSILKLLNSKYQRFLQAADLSHPKFVSLIKTGLDQDKFSKQSNLNFLILGLDQVSNRGEATTLSDTIMLLSLDTNTGQLRAISLPRDLWNQPYQTKINALYVYGQKRDPKNPTNFPQQVLEEMTNIKIDYTFITTLNQISRIIDLVGGIEVDVEQGFIDHQFPRSDVDVTTVTDPEKLYQTVEFEKGPQIMSGPRALKYIRSRMSTDAEGNDIAREKRQQQVIISLIKQLKNIYLYWYQPEIAGQMLKFYQQNFNQFLPITSLISLGQKLGPQAKNLELKTETLLISSQDESATIYHPPEWQYDGQWVYEVTDQAAFQQEIKSKLGLN